MATKKLSSEIIGLNPVIGDANAYAFSAKYKTYIDSAKIKAGSLAVLAAIARSVVGKAYSADPESIIKLGQDLLKSKSGQCDSMAAAVIAKIVAHIKENGGQWDADVELIGNGGHAFVVINRPNGPMDIPTWLGAIGVHPDWKTRLPLPEDRVIYAEKDVKKYAKMFGAKNKDLKVTIRLTAQDLKKLAKSS